MVLHNNKWDRKQNRDRVRKLKSKGKEDPAAAVAKGSDKDKAKNKTRKPGVPAQATEVTDGGSDAESQADEEAVAGDGEEPGEKAEEPGEAKEAEAPGPFNRRKVASNAWRYEEENPEFPIDTDVPSEEPEEDYVALTLSRKGGQWKDLEEEKIRTGVVDATFLKESWGKYREKPDQGKGKFFKVDKKDFVDVTERIAKKNTADAFRARFENKAKARAPRTLGGDVGGDGLEGDDLDAFLGELKSENDHSAIGIAAAVGSAGSREIRHTLSKEPDGDDEWLDQMLGR